MALALLLLATTASACFLDLDGDDSTGNETCAVDATADTDGDGRTDCDELLGYDISVDVLGFGLDSTNSESRRVTSDPDAADTDGDGLDDREEFQERIDPSSADTDADGLTDFDELRRWKTSPRTVDSDDDATDITGRNPVTALWDGNELKLVPDPENPGRMIPGPGATDPTEADTDGDGKSDLAELDDPIVDPVVADLPSVRLELIGDPDIRLNYTTTQLNGQTQSIGATLSRETSSTLSQSESYSTAYTSESSATISASVNIGVPPSASLSASGTFGSGVEQGSGTEMSSENTNRVSSAQSSEQVASVQEGYSVTSGEISVGVRVVNDSDITYRVAGLVFSVRDRNSERPLEELSLSDARSDGFVLQPNQTQELTLSKESVDAEKIRGFLRNPSALFFVPSNPDLRDENDTNLRFLDDTRPKTALVIIDDGRGVPQQLRIATNVDRADDGTRAGIDLSQALSNAGVDFVTEGTGIDEAIASVGGLRYETRGSAAPDLGDPDYGEIGGPGLRAAQRFWVLIGERVDEVEGEVGALRLDRGFSAIRLHNRDQIRLVLVSDDDGDGVYDREEYMQGARDDAIDTDGDGLSDYFEIKVGWMVQGTRVYPSPASSDFDQDGWDDDRERMEGTDPRNFDTDGDRIPDATDPDPLSPRPNEAPVVNWLDVTLERVAGSGFVVQLTGSASDADGSVERMEIDWGDGQVETVSGAAIDRLHTYQDRDGRQIRVTPFDDLGVEGAARTVSIDPEPPGRFLHVIFNGDPGPEPEPEDQDPVGVRDIAGSQSFVTLGPIQYAPDHNGVMLGAIDFSGGGSSGSGVLASTVLGQRTADETITMWVRFTTLQQERVLGTDQGLQFYVIGNRLHFGRLEGNLDDPMTRGQSASVTVTTGVWYHFAGVKRGSRLTLYQDGVERGGAIEPQDQSTMCRFYIGTFPSGNRCTGSSPAEFDNPIAIYDDVALYDRALDAAEVAVLAAQ